MHDYFIVHLSDCCTSMRGCESGTYKCRAAVFVRIRRECAKRGGDGWETSG